MAEARRPNLGPARFATLFGVVTIAHALIGGAAAIAASTGAGKPVTLGTTLLVAGIFAANFAFTGVAMATLWRTDLRRSLLGVYAPLQLCLLLLVWVGILPWIVMGLALYAALVWAARMRFHFDQRAAVVSAGALCARCGYDFVGLTRARSPVCPECGAHRLPRRGESTRKS